MQIANGDLNDTYKIGKRAGEQCARHGLWTYLGKITGGCVGGGRWPGNGEWSQGDVDYMKRVAKGHGESFIAEGGEFGQQKGGKMVKLEQKTINQETKEERAFLRLVKPVSGSSEWRALIQSCMTELTKSTILL